MKKIVFISTILFITLTQAQNSFETGTLTLRSGEILNGEVKILLGNKTIRFKDSAKKSKELNYREVEQVTIKKDDKTLVYKYKILAGKEPLLMQVIKEYKGIINLYAIEQTRDYGMIATNFAIYYVNKGSGVEVIKLGSSDMIFGKKKFKKTAKKFFNNCPELLKKIESNEFKRSNDVEQIIEYYKQNCGGS